MFRIQFEFGNGFNVIFRSIIHVCSDKQRSLNRNTNCTTEIWKLNKRARRTLIYYETLSVCSRNVCNTFYWINILSIRNSRARSSQCQYQWHAQAHNTFSVRVQAKMILLKQKINANCHCEMWVRQLSYWPMIPFCFDQWQFYFKLFCKINWG